MLLANKHLTPVVGLDIHIVTLPPGVPTPLPHPFIGLVMDPMDYIPFIGSTVNINFMPRGNSGTAGMLGTFVHIPMGGPFVMAPMIGHDSSNFFGSLTVKANDSALTPAGYMVMTCNDVGIPLSLSPGKKMKPVPSLYLPTSQSIPLPMGKPVMVGGPYPPDLMGMLMNLAMSYGFGALLKGLGKLGKKALTAFNHGVLKKIDSEFTNGLSAKLCKLGFEPVDLVDGRMVYEGVDFELPGPLPLRWERRWYSDSSYQGPMGHGFHHSYDLSMEVHQAEDAILLVLPDGRPAAFPWLIAPSDSFYNRSEKLTLTCVDAEHYRLRAHAQQQEYLFKKHLDGKYRPIELRNAAGFTLQFRYNSQYQLVGITDSVGRQVMLKLDESNRIKDISATHRGQSKQLISYSYNEAGDLVAITDALGKATIMQYQNHLMVAKTDRNGQSFYWEYDGPTTGARVVHTWGDGGILEGWIEYGRGINTVINSLGQKTLYYYNEAKLCTQVTDPLGNSIFHEYTEFMEPYRDINEEGGLTGYSYDERGNLKAVLQPDGSVTTFLHDEEDRLILVADAQGGSTVKVYGDNGLLATTIGLDGGTTSFGYNEKNLLSTIRDNKGAETQLAYDQDHNLQEVVLPDGATASWFYNEWGLCTKSTNTGKQEQAFSYDALGRVVTVYLPDSNKLDLEYDAYDDVVLAQDRSHRVKFQYTPLGSLKLREENGTKVHFNYNTEEQLTNIVNEHGEAYRFARNGRGDIVQEVGFDGLTRKYLRDRAGKVIKVERPGKKHTEYEYDLAGKLTRAEHSDGSWEAYSYDKVGRLIEAVNEQSQLLLVRDAAGRVSKEIQDGYEVMSSYDKLGNRIQVSSSLGANISLERNLLGLVTGIYASQDKTLWSAKISHNALGQEIERVMGKVSTSFNYDRGGRVREQKVASDNKTKRHKLYDWNINDKLLKITDVLNKSHKEFDYDSFGNLIKSVTSNWETETYFRDEVGNIFAKQDKSDRKYSAGGKLLENKGQKYSYDEEGNLIQKTTKEGNWLYEWSGNGILKTVTRPDGKKVSFEYDALGRRTAKVFDGKITRWVWDGNTPIHEWKYNLNDRPKTIIDELGMVSKDREEPVENLITWVFDEGTFKPAAKVENGKSYSIITDYLGTPCESYDADGEKVWSMELETYGKVKTCQGGQSFVPFRFQGQYEDTETGLYYNRFRYYSPEEGMYASQDPIGLLGGNTLYAYVTNPNDWVDVFGLMPWGEFMNGANADITSGGVTETFSSSSTGHAEMNGLNSFADRGLLSGQDVTISNVTGNFNPANTKPVGVCTKCLSLIHI